MNYFIAILILTCSVSCSNKPISVRFQKLPKVINIGDVVPVRLEIKNESNKTQRIATQAHIQQTSSFQFVLHSSDQPPSAELGDYAISIDALSTTISSLDSITSGEIRIYEFSWEAKQAGLGYLVMNSFDVSVPMPDPIRINIKGANNHTKDEKIAR